MKIILQTSQRRECMHPTWKVYPISVQSKVTHKKPTMASFYMPIELAKSLNSGAEGSFLGHRPIRADREPQDGSVGKGHGSSPGAWCPDAPCSQLYSQSLFQPAGGTSKCPRGLGISLSIQNTGVFKAETHPGTSLRSCEGQRVFPRSKQFERS